MNHSWHCNFDINPKTMYALYLNFFYVIWNGLCLYLTLDTYVDACKMNDILVEILPPNLAKYAIHSATMLHKGKFPCTKYV